MNNNLRNNQHLKENFYQDLNKLFRSKFFQNQRLISDFHNNIQDIEYWYWILDLYDNFLIKKKENQIVPKKIHQVWIGSKLPQKYKKWADSWKIKNPDFEYFLWDEKKILKLGLKNEKQYKSTESFGIKSDIARYEILNRFGGVYVDTDFECIKPLDPKFLTYDFVGCQGFSYAPEIYNGIIIATKNNIILNALIDNLKESENVVSGMDVLKYSGAIYLSNTIRKLKPSIGNLVLLPSQYFYPWPNFLKNDINIKKYFTDETFGVHHWEVSWLKKSTFKRIIDLLKKNYEKIF
tara:strand:- start:1110 stop:1988 length:879 start_codon:yes stop_codon:yes gene_type:complete